MLGLLTTVALSCARPHRPPPTIAPAELPRAFWPESRLPPVALATTLPSTRPAPLDALDLFARARAAMLEGRHTAAVPLLERAATIDPDSADVQLLLADARLATGGDPLPAVARAAELRPDDLDILLRLGGLYADRGQHDQSLLTIRRATLTRGYTESPTLTDLALARALAAGGYDLAALARYDRVLSSLRALGPRVADTPELLLLAQRPEVLYAEIAALYERNAQHADAARVLEQAVRRDPESFDLRARHARALARSGASDAALAIARAELLARGADPASVALLTDVHRLAGLDAELLAELRRLHAAAPDDAATLFTLTGVLTATDRSDEADQFLAAALARGTGGLDAARRLVALRDSRGDLRGAAAAILIAAERFPMQDHALARLISGLTDPLRPDRLRLHDLATLPTPDDAVRDFFIARGAFSMSRRSLQRQRLGSASRTYLPAMLDRALLEPLVNHRVDAAALVADARRTFGDPAAAAVKGRLWFSTRTPPDGRDDPFAPAIRGGITDSGTRSLQLVWLSTWKPDALQDAVLAALLAAGDDIAVVETAARVMAGRGDTEAVSRIVLDATRGSPDDPDADTLLAWYTVDVLRDRPRAVALAAQLVERFPGSEPAVQAAERIFTSPDTADPARWESLVTTAAARVPRALPVVRRAVAVLAAGGRNTDAERVVAASRAALGDDADLLYLLATGCRAPALADARRDLLLEVIRLDPAHAEAAADRAADLVEAGEDLAEAQRLARLALTAEPDNAGVLSTLGRLAYLRRDFTSAVDLLSRAADLAPTDAVLLDRLGDASYRAGRPAEAVAAWKRAEDALPLQGSIAPVSPVPPDLRLRLRKKLEQSARGEPPSLAPIP